MLGIAAYALLHTFYGSPGHLQPLDALTPQEAAELGPGPDPATCAGLPHCDADDLRLLAATGQTRRPPPAGA